MSSKGRQKSSPSPWSTSPKTGCSTEHLEDFASIEDRISQYFNPEFTPVLCELVLFTVRLPHVWSELKQTWYLRYSPFLEVMEGICPLSFLPGTWRAERFPAEESWEGTESEKTIRDLRRHPHCQLSDSHMSISYTAGETPGRSHHPSGDRNYDQAILADKPQKSWRSPRPWQSHLRKNFSLSSDPPQDLMIPLAFPLFFHRRKAEGKGWTNSYLPFYPHSTNISL